MSTNIDNVIITGVPSVTTTVELRNWLLNRNLPNVITEEGFQQNISMYEDSSVNFQENNNTFLRELVVGNEFYQTGAFYNNGAVGFLNLDGPVYSQTTQGELTIDTITNSSGSIMPHIECEFPEYIIPIIGSTLCDINLYSINADYPTQDTNFAGAFYNVTTNNGTTVGETNNPDNFGNLPPFMLGTFDNRYTSGIQYDSAVVSNGIVAITQSQKPSGNFPSWFDSNPLMYDLFISANFDGNFMRFDATTLNLGPIDNRFYGLKISERGFQFNNASAPNGTGVKTLYTPIEPYNDGFPEAPSVMIQNTRILEQWILGSFGTRITRDSHLLRNLFTSADMYVGSTFGIPAVDYSEGTVSLNNDYLSLAWVLSGPRKPKSTTNFFVQQLDISDSDPTYLAGGRGDWVIDGEFGQDRALVYNDSKGDMVESEAVWAPVGSSDVDFITSIMSQDVGSKGLLDYTQKIINRSPDGVSGGIGDAMRQDTTWINTKHGPKSRGSGIKGYKGGGSQDLSVPYSRSWKRTTRSTVQGDTPKSYSRYDALIRHQKLIKDGTTWSGGMSVLDDGGVPHIAQSSKNDIKRFMFSFENLAWKDEAFSRLAPHERGPNNGRLMWFPPYIESWTENSSANWTQTDIIGRMEPIFTYKNSYRQTNINFLMVTDYPEVLDTMKDNKEWSDDNSDTQASQFFGGEDFESRHKENILKKKKSVYSTQEQHEQLSEVLDNVPLTDPNDYSQPYETPDLTNINPETEPIQLWYFSGCTAPQDPDVPPEQLPPAPVCEDCVELWEGQYQETNQDSGSYMNRDNKEICGAKWGLEELAKFLATDAGKRFKIQIAYLKAPLTPGGSVNTGGYNVAYDPGQIFTGEYEVWNGEAVPVASTISDVAMEAIQQDYEVCGPIRAAKAKKKLQDLIVTAEGTAENKETWYSDEAAPDGSSAYEDERWQVISGPDMKWVDQMMKPDWKDIPLDANQQSIEQTQVNVLPVTYLIEFNPILTSDSAQEEAELEFQNLQQEATDTFNTTNTRIPDGTYFEKVQEKDSFAYETFKEKIQNFNPAFHSMHPCMLNERMTFLNQCLRAGPSIEKTSGVNNMAFGRPPVCVLRLGDFYNCKVVINNIDFSYEQPLWDLNPEGIGAQPWLVRVSMQMFIVGGMSLAGPLSQLQNATSFNYYANTEFCEPIRSNPNYGATPGPPPPPTPAAPPPSPPPAPVPEPCDPKECPSDDPNCCDPKTEPCDPKECPSDDPDCCDEQPGGTTDVDNQNSTYVGEVWHGNGFYTIFDHLWNNYLDSCVYNAGVVVHCAGEYYGWSTGITGPNGDGVDGIQLEPIASTLWVDEMSSTGAIKNYRVRWKFGTVSMNFIDDIFDYDDETKYKTDVFADTEGCVAAKTPGCAILMEKISEAHEATKLYFANEFTAKEPNMTPTLNSTFLDGTKPTTRPTMVIKFCADAQGDPFTNPNWDACQKVDSTYSPSLTNFGEGYGESGPLI